MAIESKILKNGEKRYRANIYHKGKRIKGKWFRYKKQASLDESNINHDLNSGIYIESTKITLNKAFEEYYDLIGNYNLSTNTINNEKRLYKNHLKIKFGNRKLNSLKSYEIQQYFNQLNKNLSNSTIIKLHGLLNKIFKQFIMWEKLSKNPMTRVKKPPVKYKKGDTWSINESQRFLESAKSHRSYIVFWLALNTGMRLGEILGLHWDQINFKQKVLSVNRSLNRQTMEISTPKTKNSIREINLSKSQINFLKDYKRKQSPNSIIVCANSNGDYFMERNIRRDKKLICKKAKIKEIRFHDLRHTHATLLIEMDTPIKHVQERLGRKDISTTLNTYVHTQKAHHIETAERFSEAFEI